MAAPEGTGSGPSPSLFASLRSFWSVLVAILYTRLDLVTAELEDEVARGIKMLLAAVICVFAFLVAFFIATFFFIAVYWDTDYRPTVILITLGVYLVVGIGSGLALRNMIVTRPRFLSQTIAELRRDVDGLTKAIASKKDES